MQACLGSEDPFTNALRGLLDDLPTLSYLCQKDNGQYCHLLNPSLQRLANTDGTAEDCREVNDHGGCLNTILQGSLVRSGVVCLFWLGFIWDEGRGGPF